MSNDRIGRRRGKLARTLERATVPETPACCVIPYIVHPEITRACTPSFEAIATVLLSESYVDDDVLRELRRFVRDGARSPLFGGDVNAARLEARRLEQRVKAGIGAPPTRGVAERQRGSTTTIGRRRRSMTARKLTRTAGVVLAAIPVALVAWASTGAATTGSSVLPHYGANPTNTVGVDSNSTSGVGGSAIGGTSGSRTVHATDTQTLAAQLAAGRLATAKYATNVNRAKQDGYMIITRDIPDMGWHFLNPRVSGFDIRRPPILVYTKRGSSWQLVAFEWVFPKQPTARPLPGATYGAFGAACHYKDGTFVFETNQSACTSTSPQTGAAFNFWHPGLVTLHVWLWYPNPAGLYAGTNPLMRPFNGL